MLLCDWLVCLMMLSIVATSKLKHKCIVFILIGIVRLYL